MLLGSSLAYILNEKHNVNENKWQKKNYKLNAIVKFTEFAAYFQWITIKLCQNYIFLLLFFYKKVHFFCTQKYYAQHGKKNADVCKKINVCQL